MPPVSGAIGGPGPNQPPSVPPPQQQAGGNANVSGGQDSTDEIAVATLTVSSPTVKKRSVKRSKMDQYATDKTATAEFFLKEPCLHSHRVFDRAAKIFDGLCKARLQHLQEKLKPSTKKDSRPAITESNIPDLDFNGPSEKKLTFELAFASMKYQSVFDEMLEDTAFFSVYPHFRDMAPLVMVVLYDYQSRKFQLRVPFQDEVLIKDISSIEAAIMEQKTKLGASLARRRIKNAAPNIEFLLPDNVRKQTSNQRPMPCYAWVNTLKIHPSELIQKLREEGFTHLWFPPKTMAEFKEKSFFLDSHCSDVIVFSLDCNAVLQDHPLVQQGFMVRQDKSSCLAAHSVTPLLGDDQEVIVVNPGGGLLPAHLAVLLKESRCSVMIVSEHTDEDHIKMLRNLELLGVSKIVKVLHEPFLKIDPDDLRLVKVKAALVIANCSKNAISNIVNYIVTEGENLKMLQDLTDVDDDLEEKVDRLQATHVASLRHALKLPRVQGVVYVTRSTNEAENDMVVHKSIEYTNLQQNHRRLPPWRIIPPVLPYSAEEIDEQIGIDGKFVRFLPTPMMNGCFITCMAREPETQAEAFARAKGRGPKTSLAGLNEEGETSHTDESSHHGRRKSLGHKNKGKVRKGASKTSTSATSSSKSKAKSKVGPELKVPEHLRIVRHSAPFR